MNHSVVRVVVAPLWALLLASAAAACSSAKSDPTVDAAPVAPACDSTLCAPNNTCIDNGTDTKCRLPCAAHTECPAGYSCGVNPSAGPSFCTKLTVEIAPKATGQWGTHCLPQDTRDKNPACDLDNAFACHGTGPTDANAYCTRFDCEADTDCPGNYFCATVNIAPNVNTAKRTFGKTRTVCQKRAYCSPCNADFDCPVIDGAPSRCVEGDDGVKFCGTACTSSRNCRLDATCTGLAEDGTKVCRPRAGTCKGDGTMCAPCRSDGDCPNGFCLKAMYSDETYCSVKSTKACQPQGQATLVRSEGCPAFTGFAGTLIACNADDSDESIPKDQCIGIVDLGPETNDFACYTKH